MRGLVIGGTWFLGRRVVERLHERGDEVLVVHRGRTVPDPWVAVRHLICDATTSLVTVTRFVALTRKRSSTPAR